MHGSIAQPSLVNAYAARGVARPPLPDPEAPLGRCMLLTGSIGSGHTRAAEAVCDALERGRWASEAYVVDCLVHAAAPFRALYRGAYISLIERAPTAVGWLYRTSDRIEGGAFRRSVQWNALRRLRSRIREDMPETIVCTHFLAAEVVSQMIARGEWRGRFAVVVTDLDAHALWAAAPFADAWFVATPETVEILAGKGVPRGRIHATGIPIAAAFSAPLVDRRELRRRNGLPESGPALLVSGGGVGVAFIDSTLERLLRLGIDGGMAIVCGKNKALRERVSRIVHSVRPVRMQATVLGFTDRMHELMRACDLSIGKPGGLTSSEALACGLPMAIVNPVPGQEERNSDHLLEWGAAIRLNSPESMAWRIEQLLGDPERMQRMRTSALARAQPHAAERICELLARMPEPARKTPEG